MQDGAVVINPSGNWREMEAAGAKCISKGVEFETPFDHIPNVKLYPNLLNYPQAITPNCYVDEIDRFGFVFRFCIENNTMLVQSIKLLWTAD
jgi:hypothetical protein